MACVACVHAMPKCATTTSLHLATCYIAPFSQVRSVEYTPAKRYCAMDGTPDTFQYTVTDAAGNSASATAAVVVDCPDAVFTEDQFITSEVGIPVEITTPVGGGVAPYKFEITGPPNDGKVVAIIAGEGDVTFTYRPNATYCSQDGFGDSFVFDVTEQYGTVASGTIDITILCPPGPVPGAPELIFNMTPGTSLPIDLGVSVVVELPSWRYCIISRSHGLSGL